MAKIANPKPMGLYIHVPFCTQRCIYCDFYFVTSMRSRSRFVDAVCTEISQTAQRYREIPVATIYFGGGTPSRLPHEDVAHILAVIQRCFDTQATMEITFEMNPEDVSTDDLANLRKCGITRPSVGIQSFWADDLKFLNRAHGPNQADRAIAHIKEARFKSWTLDLIFGLPDQHPTRWAVNLARAMDAPHISTYNLTIEPRTPLHRKVELGWVTPADDDTVTQAYEMAMDKLKRAGYTHYEISSFARPGHRAQHNEAYWKHSNYLGFGPSAHSFWWDHEGAHRWNNVSNLKTYLSLIDDGQAPATFTETLTLKELATESIMLGLRTREGISVKRLKDTYQLELPRERIRHLIQAQLIKRSGDRVRLTRTGRHVCDPVTTMLLPD